MPYIEIPYIERSDEEIIAALEKWANNHPYPNKATMVLGHTGYTPKEVVKAVKSKENEVFARFTDIIHTAAKLFDKDPLEFMRRS